MRKMFRLLLLLFLGGSSFAQQAVETVKVISKRLERSLRLPGELLPYQAVDIYARVTAYVEEVLVDKGSAVQSRQLLVRLAAPELSAQRAEAELKVLAIEAERAEAKAKLAAALSTYGRLQVAAATPGAVAEIEVILARESVEAARASVSMKENSAKAARASVDALKLVESYLNVTAPFDGIVTERFVHRGALVGPNLGSRSEPMLRLEEHSRLRLTVPVPETAISGIATGVKFSFTVRAYPGQIFSGVLARIPGALDPKTRSMEVELDVGNKDLLLGPGMYPEVQWVARRERPSLLVPVTSVVTTSERMFVIRVRNGRAEYVTVTQGAVNQGQVEVFGGLAPNDEIVQRGTDEIREGSTINPSHQQP
jgi:membrane fusion protein (multidrug efflux system)